MPGWPPDWTWFFYALAVVFLGLMFVLTPIQHAAERRARRGGPDEVARYNRLISGFPKGLYAKMMGKRPLKAGGSHDSGKP
jgi:hypothetical protein